MFICINFYQLTLVILYKGGTMIDEHIEEDLDILKQCISYYIVYANYIIELCCIPLMCNIAKPTKRHWSLLKNSSKKCSIIVKYLSVIKEIFENIESDNNNLLNNIPNKNFDIMFTPFVPTSKANGDFYRRYIKIVKLKIGYLTSDIFTFPNTYISIVEYLSYRLGNKNLSKDKKLKVENTINNFNLISTLLKELESKY